MKPCKHSCQMIIIMTQIQGWGRGWGEGGFFGLKRTPTFGDLIVEKFNGCGLVKSGCVPGKITPPL